MKRFGQKGVSYIQIINYFQVQALMSPPPPPTPPPPPKKNTKKKTESLHVSFEC